MNQTDGGAAAGVAEALAAGADIITITVPADGTAARVKTTAMNAICARGAATRNGAPAKAVYAKVYNGTLNRPGGGAPEVPDHVPPPGTPQVAPDAAGNWQFAAVPNAQCAAVGPLPANTLCIWVAFNMDATFYSIVSHFTGQCSNRTDCEVPAAQGSADGYATV